MKCHDDRHDQIHIGQHQKELLCRQEVDRIISLGFLTPEDDKSTEDNKSHESRGDDLLDHDKARGDGDC